MRDMSRSENSRRRIYKLLMGDKYRRRKLKQGEGNDLMPEWDPDEDTQLQDENELLEFLNGRIDGSLFAWGEITGWIVSNVAELVIEHNDPFWQAEPYEWIDLSVVDTEDGEQQCPWCGDIYREDYLLWLDTPEWSDSELVAKVCDDCAETWVERERVSKAQSERADRVGGQKPIDGSYEEKA